MESNAADHKQLNIMDRTFILSALASYEMQLDNAEIAKDIKNIAFLKAQIHEAKFILATCC